MEPNSMSVDNAITGETDGGSLAERTWSGMVSAANATSNFCHDTIVWRRPIASSAYMLVVNTCFWASVFYLDRTTKLTVLVGLATTLIFFDATTYSPTFASSCRQLYSDLIKFLHDTALDKLWTILKTTILLKPVIVLLKFLFTYIGTWAFLKTAELVAICLSSCSAWLLVNDENEKACWLAYGTVVVVLVTPPWRCNRVTEQIISHTAIVCHRSCSVVDEYVLQPTLVVFGRLKRILTYYIFFQWLPPLLHKLQAYYSGAKYFIQTRVFAPVGEFLCKALRLIRYYFLLEWLPPLLRRINEKRRDVCNFVSTKWAAFTSILYRDLWRPLVDRVKVLCGWVSYIFLGRWVPPLCSWIRDHVLQPCYNAAVTVKNWLVYLLLFRWLPPLLAAVKSTANKGLEFIKNRCLLPLLHGCLNAVRAVKNALVRLVTDTENFIHDVVTGTTKLVTDTVIAIRNFVVRLVYGVRDFVVNTVFSIRDGLHGAAVGTRNWLKDTAVATKNYCLNTAIATKDCCWAAAKTTKNLSIAALFAVRDYIIASAVAVKLFVKTNVVQPFLAWLSTLRQQITNALIVHVIRPSMEATQAATAASSAWMYYNVVHPLWIYCEVWMRRFKHSVMTQWVHPGLEWVKEKLPEKSPFLEFGAYQSYSLECIWKRTAFHWQHFTTEFGAYQSYSLECIWKRTAFHWQHFTTDVDSDHEFCDFIPGGMQNLSMRPSYANSEAELSESGFTPMQGRSAQISRKASETDLDLHDDDNFTSGMKFPSIHHSDSSDDEFSLRPRRRHHRRKEVANSDSPAANVSSTASTPNASPRPATERPPSLSGTPRTRKVMKKKRTAIPSERLMEDDLEDLDFRQVSTEDEDGGLTRGQMAAAVGGGLWSAAQYAAGMTASVVSGLVAPIVGPSATNGEDDLQQQHDDRQTPLAELDVDPATSTPTLDRTRESDPSEMDVGLPPIDGEGGAAVIQPETNNIPPSPRQTELGSGGSVTALDECFVVLPVQKQIVPLPPEKKVDEDFEILDATDI